MKRLIIVLLGASLFAMKDDTRIDIQPSDQKQNSLACECKFCRGIKIAVASNVVSILTTAAVTMFINYSQCGK